jgi:putative DNA primase/helicase
VTEEWVSLDEARRRRKEAEAKAEAENAPQPSKQAPPDAKTTQAEICRLASLDKYAYQRERADAAKVLALNIGFLDQQVKAEQEARRAGSDSLPEIEPWADPVDGAELLDEFALAIKRHVAVPTRGEDAVALWALHAHCLDAAEHSPRLEIGSAAPECGKSTLLGIVGDLVPRTLYAANITPAATFRAIEKWRPTLMIDEADTFLQGNDELRGVLDCGHARDGYIVRNVGDDHEPRRFSTWSAVAIAMIGKLPATLASRAIRIELQRLSRTEHVEPYRPRKAPYADLARQAARWAADNIEALCDAEPEMPEGITNRRADNWRALFAIADRAGGDWSGVSGKAREAALTLDHVDAGQTTGIILLEDIRTVLTGRTGDGKITSKALAEELAKMEGRPWPEFGRSKKPITTNAIARLLKPFNVFPLDMRDPHTFKACKGYHVEPLQAVFERYLSP